MASDSLRVFCKQGVSGSSPLSFTIKYRFSSSALQPMTARPHPRPVDKRSYPHCGFKWCWAVGSCQPSDLWIVLDRYGEREVDDEECDHCQHHGNFTIAAFQLQAAAGRELRMGRAQ